MSYIYRTYGCAACEKAGRPHTFELFQKREDLPPRYCPNCGAMVEGGAALPSKIAIGGSPIVKAVDGTYRWSEESSAARAEEHNAPFMKITDMKDRLREGDIAAVNTPVSQQMAWFRQAMRDSYGVSYGWQGGMGAVADTSTGSASSNIAPNVPVHELPASVALSSIQGQGGQTHAARRAQIEASPTAKHGRK